MSESRNFKDVMKRNRIIFLAVLMMPVIGMVIAIPLIISRKPESIMVAVPIILLLIIQYGLLVWWISKKIDQLTGE